MFDLLVKSDAAAHASSGLRCVEWQIDESVIVGKKITKSFVL